MTTNKLADTFLNDLENLSDDSFEEEKENHQAPKIDFFGKKKQDLLPQSLNNKIKYRSSLITDNKFLNFIQEITDEIEKKRQIVPSNLTKNDRLYYLINESNDYAYKINIEINAVTLSIKEIYSKRFPELESLIPNNVEYVLTVKKIGNKVESIKNVDLSSILQNHNIMAINIISSTTSGKALSDSDLNALIKLCDDVIEMNEHKKKLITFTEKQMNIVAPNLSSLVGQNIAAKLVSAAGGIVELSKMPACNVLVLGAQRKNLEGFSTAGKLHKGFLAESELYLKTPEDYQIQALRKLANKCVLAARCDAFRKVVVVGKDEISEKTDSMEVDEKSFPIEKPSTKNGEMFKDLIEKKMGKIQEPKKAKELKVLPRPDDKPRRKRGGKRIRSIKKITELTDVRKMKNRMRFGPDAEVEFRDTGKGYGLLGVGGPGGKIKASVKKGQKINTKKQNLVALQANKGNSSGLYSSVVIEAPQGINLINPELLEKKVELSEKKYFSNTSGFNTVVAARKDKPLLEL